MAQSAWDCPHLTSMLLEEVGFINVWSAGGVQCTALRQLHVVDSKFDGGAFPEQLCTALCHLTSLLVMQHCLTPPVLTRLPPDFSQLRCARELP